MLYNDSIDNFLLNFVISCLRAVCLLFLNLHEGINEWMNGVY